MGRDSTYGFLIPLTFVLALSCDPLQAPPLGEALFIIDTNMPFASRLRVDFYTLDGVWYASRDIPTFSHDAWPVSFSAFIPTGTGRSAIVRMRAYPDGKTRDYRGERFVPVPDDPQSIDVHVASPTSGPMLVGADTPTTEPRPELAIDRLVLVELTPGVRGSARVLLDGNCVGTMADIAGGRTCVDTEHQLVAVTPTKLDPNMSIPPPVKKHYGASYETSCTIAPRAGRTGPGGIPLLDEEVCVPGGMFVYG